MNPLKESSVTWSRRFSLISAQKILGLALLALGLGCGAPGTVSAASVTVYTYYSPNPAEYVMIRTPRIGDAVYANSGFEVTDDQATRYTNILTSGRVIGSASFARGMDVVEDWRFHWLAPEASNSSATGTDHYIRIDDDIEFNFTYNAPLQTAAGVDAHAQEAFLGNPSLVAMSFERAIFFDDDDTFSSYVYFDTSNIGNAGLMWFDYQWTTLSGGDSFNGVTLSRPFLEDHFIGAEQNEIGLLVSDSTVDYYDLRDGSYLRRVDYRVAQEGPLSQYSLVDIIDGKVPGYHYLGLQWGPVIAHMVPEPSLGTLFLLAVAGGLRRRRVS